MLRRHEGAKIVVAIVMGRDPGGGGRRVRDQNKNHNMFFPVVKSSLLLFLLPKTEFRYRGGRAESIRTRLGVGR